MRLHVFVLHCAVFQSEYNVIVCFVMAYKYREDLVGKRFLSVSGVTKNNVNKVSEWGWKAGIIRAASLKDNKNKELQVIFGPHYEKCDNFKSKFNSWFDLIFSCDFKRTHFEGFAPGFRSVG